MTGSVGPLIAALAGHPVRRARRAASRRSRRSSCTTTTAAAVAAASAVARRALRDARGADDLVRAAVRFAAAASGRDLPQRLPDARRPRGARAHLRRQHGACGCSTACPHDLLTVGGYVVLAAGRVCRSSPRCGGCSPRSARCAPRRRPAAWSSSWPARWAARRSSARRSRRSRRARSVLWLALLAGTRGRAASASAGRPTSRSRCSRRRWCSPASARWPASSRRRGAARSGSRRGVLGRRAAAAHGRRHLRGLGWLRWATPLGWAEELRPFAGARPAVLLLPAVATALLLVAAARIAERRDVGAGPAPGPRQRAAAPGAALVAGRAGAAHASAAACSPGSPASASSRRSSARRLRQRRVRVSRELHEQLAKLGTARRRPRASWASSSCSSCSALCLFACFQLAAACREEEVEQRLETLFALPVSRGALARRAAALARCAAVALALPPACSPGPAPRLAGRRRLVRRHARGGRELPARRRCCSSAWRRCARSRPARGTAIAYGLVGVAFLWDTVGALVAAPGWARDLSPFHDVGLVPARGLPGRRRGDDGGHRRARRPAGSVALRAPRPQRSVTRATSPSSSISRCSVSSGIHTRCG